MFFFFLVRLGGIGTLELILVAQSHQIEDLATRLPSRSLKGVVVRVAIAQEGQFLTCMAKLDGLFEEFLYTTLHNHYTYFPYVPYFSWQTWETVARWYPKIGSRIPSNPSVGFFGGDLLRYDRQLRKWLGQHGARVVRGTQLPRNLGGKSQEWMVKYGKYHVNDHEWSRMTSNRWVGL